MDADKLGWEQRVAIVGMGAVFPQSLTLEDFWANLVAGRSAARAVPPGRWQLADEDAYAAGGPRPDRVYSLHGCFVEDFTSPWLPAGVSGASRSLAARREQTAPRSAMALALPPELLTRLPGLDPLVHWTIHAGCQAWADAAMASVDRQRVGVILGNIALPTEGASAWARAVLGPTFAQQIGLPWPIPHRSESEGQKPPIDPLNRYVTGLPGGLLAQALGLGGGSWTLDAACASSLYALKLAADELLAGRADAMLTGGVSRPDCLYTQMGFAQLRALSPSGRCAPFDQRADGLVVGEGAGIFVLKRLRDALAAGDRIYAVLAGAGLSNDVGGNLLAPDSEGQVRAMRAAYRQADWSPALVDHVECHATGTPVGDAVEFASLNELWREADTRGRGQRCVLGAVKSNVGHLLTGAGAAGLAKTLLAMRHGVLPPTAHFATAASKVALSASPFAVLSEARAWPTSSAPRRAAVSGFGFGGINAHLLLEEWRQENINSWPILPQPILPQPILPQPILPQPILPTSLDSSTVEEAFQESKLHSNQQEILEPENPSKKPYNPQEKSATKSFSDGREPLAIVGMAARFGPWNDDAAVRERLLGLSEPRLPEPPRYWWGVDSTTSMPGVSPHASPYPHRLESLWGYYLHEWQAPLDRFRIPPLEREEMLPQQLLMLEVADTALANLDLDRIDRNRMGAFVGLALDLNTTQFQFRWSLLNTGRQWAAKLGLSPEDTDRWVASLRAAAGPPLTANRTMGALGGIVASRLAREFRLGGPCFTISSEESSGLRALEVACRALQRGELDMALVAAVDLAGEVRAVLGHHADRPFSVVGAHPGEGAVALVLKRRTDAVAAGEKMLAVVRGIGSASGPAGKGVPQVATYRAALVRAYADVEDAERPESGDVDKSDYNSKITQKNLINHEDPNTRAHAVVERNDHAESAGQRAKPWTQVGCVVAHGSGFGPENQVEAKALADFFPPRTRVTSALTLVGHVGAASGLAGIVQAIHALQQRILPPPIFLVHSSNTHVSQITSNSGQPSSLGTENARLEMSRPWLHHRADGPRRMGVSSMSVEGNVVHAVLDAADPAHAMAPVAPLPRYREGVFLLPARAEEFMPQREKLDHLAQHFTGSIGDLAGIWWRENPISPQEHAIVVVASDAATLRQLLQQSLDYLRDNNRPGFRDQPRAAMDAQSPGSTRNPGIYYSPHPLAKTGQVAFVYPGSGNHYPDMGRTLLRDWPELLQRQEAENLFLGQQFPGEKFWSDTCTEDPRALIFGQVCFGSFVTDWLQLFAIRPSVALGYSLGESAALFGLRAWRDRDGMLRRMQQSTLFTQDLTGVCAAARQVWGLAEHEPVDWHAAVINRPAEVVRQALLGRDRVYLLIVNTAGECVIGGTRAEVEAVAHAVGGALVPLQGVTTVHCQVANVIETAYRELHHWPTFPPPGVSFYSGAWGRAYNLDSDSAADAIAAQAVGPIDFPAVVEAAYADGARLFVEVGPGASCTRMIGKVLEGRPHLARAVAAPRQEDASSLLRLLAELRAEGVPVDWNALYGEPKIDRDTGTNAPKKARATQPARVLSMIAGGRPFVVPTPPAPRVSAPFAHHTEELTPFTHQVIPNLMAPTPENSFLSQSSTADIPIPSEIKYTMNNPNDTHGIPAHGEEASSLAMEINLANGAAATAAALGDAHAAYLQLSQTLANTATELVARQMQLLARVAQTAPHAPWAPMDYSSPSQPAIGLVAPSEPALTNDVRNMSHDNFHSSDVMNSSAHGSGASSSPPDAVPRALTRAQCLEFAVGKIADVLGPRFAAVDQFPTRVRLPDEPLMLVDRILHIEGEPGSMGQGRVITEHDIGPGAWYLDAQRIPTCIAVEAGQADLFLSGFLGIDEQTRGLAVYRLLDAVVTFHQHLPGPGVMIHYDIRINRFFRQGDTHLFRFEFDGTVDGKPLLTMRAGCAGFFTAAELASGKGIVHTALDKRPRSGVTTPDWKPLIPMEHEAYDAMALTALRAGDLQAAFGPLFSGLTLASPLRLPGGPMTLVHRIARLEPQGGKFGLGLILGEADIHPNDWFLTCHFVDDQVMPGTLMFECCLHTLRIFLLRQGWVVEDGDLAGSGYNDHGNDNNSNDNDSNDISRQQVSSVGCEPVPGIASQLKCRGQVTAATRVAAYEVTIKEIGYRPEPYVLADALMFADGKPIVEITDMSLRIAGLNQEKIAQVWRRQNATLSSAMATTQIAGGPKGPVSAAHPTSTLTTLPEPQEKIYPRIGTRTDPLYDYNRILAFAVGKPSEAFGEPYRVFDHQRVIARLPGPPYQFLDRVITVSCEPWKMVSGGVITAEYDVPPDAWYFTAQRQHEMPFAVLLEVALQPCGWLAAYVGSALTSPTDLSFRNLGGTGVLHHAVRPDVGTLTTTVTITKVASSGGMIIQHYDFAVRQENRVIYEGNTYFGFFSKEALANQIGIRDARLYIPNDSERGAGLTCPYPDEAPYPAPPLRMMDTVQLFVPDGGAAGLGFIEGVKKVIPDEWFFQAHFYQDPVWPGSLGLEAFLQLLLYVAERRWGGTGWQSIALGETHEWVYRGQVIPPDLGVTIQASITQRDDERQRLQADGFLTVDGRTIYQMKNFSLEQRK